MTATGCYNLGDEIILKAEVAFIKSQYENVDITVFTYDKESTLLPEWSVRYVNYFPNRFWRHPLRNIWYFFENIWLIRSADFLIIGGGGLIFDNERGISYPALLRQWRFRTKLARIFGTHIFFWSLGLEVKKAYNRTKLKKLFVSDDIITVRDERSLGLLESLEYVARLVPDSAFLLESNNSVVMRNPPRVGFSLRSGFLTEAEEKAVPEIVKTLESRWFEVLFLSHSFSKEAEHNDLECIRRIMKDHTYAITFTLAESMEAYRSLSYMVGMRYHSGILAAAHGIPVLMVPYGPKSVELMRILEIPESIESGYFTHEEFFLHWDSLVANYETRKFAIIQKYDTIHKELIKKLDEV